ncbi:MAG: ribose 5-phosphate isomerase B [Oscillospiraceae bacterium]|jgi:ribose 5-phosphate isomerase B|nr:ribose 5-phosphate isomerase B [Oscillospiraceae bacterium]
MIALASDHNGFYLMKKIRVYLEENGYSYKDFGTFSPDSCDYPAIAIPAAKSIATGECDKGIFICGTGIGVSIAANKIKGIRAALCTSVFMAEMARNHNDANVLATGVNVVDDDLAIEMVKVFLTTEFSDEEKHHRRVAMLNAEG